MKRSKSLYLQKLVISHQNLITSFPNKKAKQNQCVNLFSVKLITHVQVQKEYI